jgi:hypothetical protein
VTPLPCLDSICPHVFRNLFSSKKVLQMSYANYQCGRHSCLLFVINSDHLRLPEEKKLLLKNSKTHALWTSVRHGGLKSFIPNLGPIRACQSLSPRPRISGGRNAAPSIAVRCSSLVSEAGAVGDNAPAQTEDTDNQTNDIANGEVSTGLAYSTVLVCMHQENQEKTYYP